MQKPKVLIVDDEPFNVDYIQQELEDLALDTISAENGQEALEKIQTLAPDLVLLDIMMPILDGFAVLARVKNDPVTRDIPIIVISAQNDLSSVVRGIQMGAEDYLPKPFEPVLLKARITSGLEKKRLRDLEHLYLESLERELDIARDIQMGFLPTELPVVPGWDIAAYFKSAREVAGDFYDAFMLPDGNLMFVIGDVCDKGVGAALFMTLFRSLIRATATSDLSCNGQDISTISPGQRLQNIVSFTNRYIVETHDAANMFASVFVGIIHLHERELTYINCGNPPPLLVRSDGAVTPLGTTGPALGIIPDAAFGAVQVPMASGDLLLAFTDGIPDAIDARNAPFGTSRVLELLKTDQRSPGSLLENIASALEAFIGEANQFDDITLLSVKRI